MKIKLLMCALWLLSACDKAPAPQASFAGLGSEAADFAQVVPGKVFPFCFITIACGAISGFHTLIASGITPKIISRETSRFK